MSRGPCEWVQTSQEPLGDLQAPPSLSLWEFYILNLQVPGVLWLYPPSYGVEGGRVIEAQRGEAPAKITPGSVAIPGVEPCFLLPGGVFPGPGLGLCMGTKLSRGNAGGEMLELRMELEKGVSQPDTNGKLGLSAGGRSGLDLVKHCTLLMLKPGLFPQITCIRTRDHGQSKNRVKHFKSFQRGSCP